MNLFDKIFMILATCLLILYILLLTIIYNDHRSSKNLLPKSKIQILKKILEKNDKQRAASWLRKAIKKITKKGS